MILQASCLSRLSNKLREKTAVDPRVIMAIYIHSDLDFPAISAHEYLVYEPDPLDKKASVQMRLVTF